MTKRILAAVAALAMASAAPAAAETIAFDYSGGGCTGGSTTCIALDSFDWLQGNSMLVITSDTTGYIVYQASLDSAITPTTPTGDFSNGDGGNYFTATATFDVTLTGGGNFIVDSGGEFTIYYDTTNDVDNLAGTGFDDGTAILSGEATFGGGTFNFFSPTLAPQLRSTPSTRTTTRIT